MSLFSQGKLIAPKDKFRIVVVDTFESWDADALVDDVNSRDRAIEIADKTAKGDPYTHCYVYDDKGALVHESTGKKVSRQK